MKFIWVITLLFIVGCHTKNSNDRTTKTVKKIDSLKTQFKGQWGGLGEDDPVFEIKDDLIYYFEEKKTYPYQFAGKDLIIQRTESKGVLKNISVVNDTMTFYDEQGFSIKAYRFKNRK
jgi:hypothetical protein